MMYHTFQIHVLHIPALMFNTLTEEEAQEEAHSELGELSCDASRIVSLMS